VSSRALLGAADSYISLVGIAELVLTYRWSEELKCMVVLGWKSN